MFKILIQHNSIAIRPNTSKTAKNIKTCNKYIKPKLTRYNKKVICFKNETVKHKNKTTVKQ